MNKDDITRGEIVCNQAVKYHNEGKDRERNIALEELYKVMDKYYAISSFQYIINL